jgi:hypothetical protein
MGHSVRQLKPIKDLLRPKPKSILKHPFEVTRQSMVVLSAAKSSTDMAMAGRAMCE